MARSVRAVASSLLLKLVFGSASEKNMQNGYHPSKVIEFGSNMTSKSKIFLCLGSAEGYGNFSSKRVLLKDPHSIL